MIITVRIFETPEIWQDVNCYVDEIEPCLYDVEIKMPLYLEPSCIATDIRCALDDEGLRGRVNEIFYTTAPKEFAA